MRIARWLRREVMMPLLFLAAAGVALYWLTQKLDQLGWLEEQGFAFWLLAACYVIYVILAVISVRHIATTYLLERYHPGDPRSVRRLQRKLRFRLPRQWQGDGLVHFLSIRLEQDGFNREGGDRRTGIVYSRDSRHLWTRRRRTDRVIMLESSSINIFQVDQMLKDCIYQLDRVERKSERNILVIAVRMEQSADVASAAAGCVNYLGLFQSGTLFPVLVDLNGRRFYYPANRSAIKRSHRFFQNRMLFLIRQIGLVSASDKLQDIAEKAEK